MQSMSDDSGSDFDDPDSLEVPGGGKTLGSLSKPKPPSPVIISPTSTIKLVQVIPSSTSRDSIPRPKFHLEFRDGGLRFATTSRGTSSLAVDAAIDSTENTEEEGMGVAETYADYMPAKLKIGQKHPDPVVESTSLSSVEPVDVWYKLKIPFEVIQTGSLSALQLEAITYACQKHETILPSGVRGGFLIGDGAGVGKGRTIAGIIFENYLNKRKKSVWVSVMSDLKYDAQRDLNDVHAKRIKVHSLNKCKYSKLSGPENGSIKKGVLFCTYSALIARTAQSTELESRIDQIVEWCGPDFEGPLVFDECHRAKNLCTSGSSKATKTGAMVMELQVRLPQARVVYASATGATEPRNMAYMVRLGMWGPGTAYCDFNHFLSILHKRGVGAMEIVAMEMKLNGLYIARQLSFQGVAFKITEVPLNRKFVEVYDRATNLWIETFKSFRDAASILPKNKPGHLKTMWSQFWSAHQRFFKLMCISAKVHHAVKIATESIKCGKCVVIGLQSTGEARTSSLVEKDQELIDFVSTAYGVIKALVEKHFPIPEEGTARKRAASTRKSRKWARMTEEDDEVILKTSEYDDMEFEIEDNDNNTTLLDEAHLKKNTLLNKIKQLEKALPPNSLDELIDELGGPENVAEMTGRKCRIVQDDAGYKYESRSEADTPLELLNLKEKERFMSGEKVVAVISEAASSGISLHSDKRAINKKGRVHITLELPWSADQAIQQFGRTHRSNQMNAPEYVLLISNLAGERRFASIVARRLESLGALTHGDRRASEAHEMTKFNIDNNYGRKAVELTLKSIIGQIKPLVPPPSDYGNNFTKDALDGLIAVGIVLPPESSNEFCLDGDKKSLSKFLNRILGLPVKLQNAIFTYFTQTMEAIIESAKKAGTFDLGILDVAANDKNTKRIVSFRFERKSLSGKLITELHRVAVERGMNWKEACKVQKENTGKPGAFFLSKATRNGNSEVLLTAIYNSEKSSKENEDVFNVYRPNVGLQLKRQPLKTLLKRFKKVEPNDAEPHWKKHYTASSKTCAHAFWSGICKQTLSGLECDAGLRFRTYNILSGSVLSLWNSIETIVNEASGDTRLQMVRVKTCEADKIVGTLIPSSCFQRLYDFLKETSENVSSH